MAARITAISVFAIAFAPACFGDGPVPVAPTEATILYTAEFQAGTECEGSRYIGSVSIGPLTDGYAVTLPYVPQNPENCSGGGIPPGIELSADRFLKDRKDQSAIGGAGKSDGTQPPRIAAAGTSPVWVFPGEGQPSTTLLVAPALGSIQGSTGATFPVGVVTDDTTIYVAGWPQRPTGKPEVNHPTYPCCGPFQLGNTTGGGTGGFTLSKLPRAGGSTTTLPVTPFFACETMSDCLVGNTSSLFYMEHAEPAHVANITQFPKTGTTLADAIPIGTVDRGGLDAVAPVGLAVNDAHVAWSVSNRFEQQRSEDPLPQPLCLITAVDLTTQATKVLLSTTEFSCMHLAIDAGFVYFAIVSIADQHMRGDGVGRVSLTDETFESLTLGIQGDAAGPRRVYVVDDSMYLVDPFAIGVVKTSALDGKHDFTK